MPSVEVPERSSIARLVGTELPTTRILPTPMSSSSLSEKMDYSGDNDADLDDVHSAPDSSKCFHLAEEEVQVAAPGIEPPSGETLTIEGIFSFLNHHFFF